jgi:hypothetical protein
MIVRCAIESSSNETCSLRIVIDRSRFVHCLSGIYLRDSDDYVTIINERQIDERKVTIRKHRIRHIKRPCEFLRIIFMSLVFNEFDEHTT